VDNSVKAVLAIIGAIAAIITICAFVFGFTNLGQVLSGFASSSPVPQSSAVGSRQQIPPATATPATTTITENMQLQCIDCNGGGHYVLGIVLQRIVIDPVAGTTSMYFKITDDDPSTAGGLELTFITLTMQNQSDGTLITAAEQRTASWSLNYQNSMIEKGTFLVVPKHGSTWMLAVSLGEPVAYDMDYKDVTLSF
jgi:hypothetical protein